MGVQNFTLDTALIAKDAGAVTSSAAAQVGGSAKVIDLGAAAEVQGNVVIDVSAIDIASTNELYTIIVQLSSSSSFASDILNVCQIELGDAAAILGGATVEGAIGRYVLPFRNEQNGTARRYLRLYTVCAGTTPSINYMAFLAKVDAKG